jgi:hypothetical protein
VKFVVLFFQIHGQEKNRKVETKRQKETTPPNSSTTTTSEPNIQAKPGTNTN